MMNSSLDEQRPDERRRMNDPDERSAMMTRRYRIEHRTTYQYSDEVSTSFGRGYLHPRDMPGQRCLQHRLVVEPTPSDVSHGTDAYGNANTYFHVTDPHTTLSVVGLSDVEVSSPEPDPAVLALPWERARPSATADARAVEFTLASPLVRMPAQIREYAEVSFTPGRPIIDAVNDLTHRIFTEFKYESGATSVSSTVTDVLEAKAGVCQDFAHVAIAGLRSLGLAGRYVSGYLATYPPPGKPRMIGADASHAWAAVRLSDNTWLAFDPTNDTLADVRYTVVAWGRDYDDVPPLRGVIYTDAKERKMDVSVDVAPL
jgi:transglutaminase-like putative cysteine protease